MQRKQEKHDASMGGGEGEGGMNATETACESDQCQTYWKRLESSHYKSIQGMKEKHE